MKLAIALVFVSVVLLAGGRADAKDPGGADKPEECESGNLAGWEGGADKDLLVSGKECKISKGTHTYRHVHVWGKGKLHFEDKGEEIHFWANAILIETDGSLVAGEASKRFSDENGVCPAAEDKRPNDFCEVQNLKPLQNRRR